MASVVQRPRSDGKSSWQIRWMEDGRQQATTAPDRKSAYRIKAIVEATGTYRDEFGRPDVPTVTAQAEVWLAQHTRGNPTTLREYRRYIDQHIAPKLGEVALTALSPAMLTTWARELPVADKTRANVTAVLSGVLESAVPEWLLANPWKKVRLAKTDPPKEPHFLTWEDFGILLAEIPDHHKPLVATLGTTGMRWGEAAALTVGDLSFRDGRPVFRIYKAVKHRARQTDEPGRPKTDKARRTVVGSELLTDVLQALTDRPKTALLFTATKGGRLRNSTFHTTVWQPALDRAVEKGLPFRPRVHDLRAAATSWLIDGGMPMDQVADMLGHTSIDTTHRIYRRSNPEAGARAAEVMTAGLRRAIGPS